MKIEFEGISRKGGRKINEDSFLMLKDEDAEYCFAVADGLGGHGKGEVASDTAIRSVENLFSRHYASQNDKLAAYFEESQRNVLKKQNEIENGKNMRTTLSVLSIAQGWAYWGHIGDSRIYCFKNNRVAWHTLDHSVPQMLVAMGEITDKEIRWHEDRNRLLKVIGAEWNGPEYELAKKPFRPRPDDKFLICSDGFWENIEDNEMLSCSRKAKNATEWLALMKKIVQGKTSNTDSDNYTAITVWFK